MKERAGYEHKYTYTHVHTRALHLLLSSQCPFFSPISYVWPNHDLKPLLPHFTALILVLFKHVSSALTQSDRTHEGQSVTHKRFKKINLSITRFLSGKCTESISIIQFGGPIFILYLALVYTGHFPPCFIPLGMSVSTKGPSDVLGSRKTQISPKDKSVPCVRLHYSQ